MHRPVPTLFLAAALSYACGAAAQAQTSCVPTVPCTDRDGCPDLIVDRGDLALHLQLGRETWTAADCSVIEGEVIAGDRWLLRFDSTTPNLGPGDLIIGNPVDHPEWFNFETCHGHPHFKEYTDYRLWTEKGYSSWQELRAANPGVCARDLLAAHPMLARQMVSGKKQGFCVVDVWPYALGACAGVRPHKRYVGCDDMGLSVCQSDIYDAYLDGQWVDVTGLQSGGYVLEVEVNAEHFFQETDYTNNSTSIPVALPRGLR